MTRLAGKVAFITGAARGQGRAEAIRFAQEGAALILSDVASEGIADLPYTLGTEEELAETVSLCESFDVDVIADSVDTRDLSGLQELAQAGAKRFGGMDVVVANAGIYSVGRLTVPDHDARVEVLSTQKLARHDRRQCDRRLQLRQCRQRRLVLGVGRGTIHHGRDIAGRCWNCAIAARR